VLQYDTFEGDVVVIAAPVIEFVGLPYQIAEGDGVTLAVSVTPLGSTNTLGEPVTWDLDGDGRFGDAAGETVTLTWEQLIDLGLSDDGAFQVGASAVNGDGFSAQAFETLTIDNTPPTLSVVGADVAQVDAAYELSFSATDPGADRVFEWRIDWGDGTQETFGSGANRAAHVYRDPGPVLIQVGAVDEDSAPDATLAVPPKSVNVVVTREQVNPGGPYVIAEGDDLTLAGSAVGTPVAYGWDVNGDGDFGDAAGSNPTLTWAALQSLGTPVDDSGTFDVLLQVTYASGPAVVSNAGTLTILNTAPTAVLGNDGPVDEGGGATVSFSGQSDPSNADTAAGFRYSYDFDNDGTFELENVAAASVSVPTSLLTDNGTLTVRASITDKDGGSSEAFTEITVREVAPTLNLTGANDTTVGATYQLDLSATDPGNDTIQRWIVDWDDGVVETYDGPVHSLSHGFAGDGVRTVSVTAIDEDGYYTAPKAVTVENVAPQLVNLSVTDAEENGFSFLTGTISDPGTLDSFTVVFDWGDGSQTERFNLAPGQYEFSALHRYLDDVPSGTSSDAFTVTAAVEDDAGASSSATTSATVFNAAPGVSLGLANAVVGETGLVVVGGTVEDVGTLDSHTVTLNWGDGTSEDVAVDPVTRAFSASHRYEDDGVTGTLFDDYAITATVQDDDGGVGGGSVTMTIASVAANVRGFTVTPEVIDENGSVSVSGSYVEVSSLDTQRVVIDWGDGTESEATVDAGAQTFTATHRYLDDDPSETPSDAYTIVAKVIDDDGAVGDASLQVTVNNLAPALVDLTLASDTVAEGEPMVVTGRITDVGSLDTHIVTVDWGDGIASDATVDPSTRTFVASHAYGEDSTGLSGGTYAISVTVTDDDGNSETDDTSVTVVNTAPTLTVGGFAQVYVGEVYTLELSSSDPGDDTITFWAIDWGDGEVEIVGGNPDSATHVYADMAAGPVSIVASATDEDGAYLVPEFVVEVLLRPLQVTDFGFDGNGFVVQFNDAFDPTLINLYDSALVGLGAADITLVGDTTGAVKGSLVLDADSRSLRFLRTGQGLAPDTYTVTLRSSENAFRNASGLLDGNGDNVVGDDFVERFTVAPFSPVRLSLPDFTRGPGQPVDVPATAAGLPLLLASDGSVQQLAFEIRYDSALLIIAGANPGSGLPAGVTLSSDATTPGLLRVEIDAPAALAAGNLELLRLVANVPASADYGAAQVLDIANVEVNGAAVQGADGDALHAVGYLGDANGSQTYEREDVTLIQRNLVRLDNGFAAWRDVDPAIIADIDGNGLLTSLDAARVNQELSGYDRPEIPPIPDLTLLRAPALMAMPNTFEEPPRIDFSKRYPGFTFKSYQAGNDSAGWQEAFVSNVADSDELNPNRNLRVTLDTTPDAASDVNLL
jgi:hypothetical protein